MSCDDDVAGSERGVVGRSAFSSSRATSEALQAGSKHTPFLSVLLVYFRISVTWH